MKKQSLKTLTLKPLNFSNPSDMFPQQFIDLLDDMIIESTSNNDQQFLDDLLSLIYTRVEDSRKYYKSSLNTCDHYLNQIGQRKVSLSYDEILKAEDILNKM